MPKRGVVASILTTIALVVLINFKTPSQDSLQIARGGGAVAIGQPRQVAASVTPEAGQGSTASQGSTAGQDSTAGQASSTSGQGGGAGDGQSASGPGPSPVPTAAPKTASRANGQFTGAVVGTPYGDVQVQIKLSAGKIADIVPLQLPSDRFRSQMIAQYAEPILRSEALQAQNANIDIVSGATYTSEGYAQSLQSALDQAKS